MPPTLAQCSNTQQFQLPTFTNGTNFLRTYHCRLPDIIKAMSKWWRKKYCAPNKCYLAQVLGDIAKIWRRWSQKVFGCPLGGCHLVPTGCQLLHFVKVGAWCGFLFAAAVPPNWRILIWKRTLEKSQNKCNKFGQLDQHLPIGGFWLQSDKVPTM